MEETAKIGNSKEAVVIEVGRYAKQADGAVVVRQGGTAVLVTAVMSDEPNKEIDFTPLTVDYRERPYVLAITGASAALHISRIPFEGPIAGVRVCRVNGEFVANPTYEERKEADLEIVMAGTRDAIVMVEGGAKEVPEEVITEALFFGHEAIQEVIELQEKLRDSLGVPKVDFEGIELDSELVKALEEECSDNTRYLRSFTSTLDTSSRS